VVAVFYCQTGWPDWANFRTLGDCLLWAFFYPTHVGSSCLQLRLIINFGKKFIGQILCDFYTKSSGHTVAKPIPNWSSQSWLQFPEHVEARMAGLGDNEGDCSWAVVDNRDRELQRQRCKKYNATVSLWSASSTLKKRSSLLQTWLVYIRIMYSSPNLAREL
jgi:hypothetical protein